ncbi:MAG: hypothetical protein V4675_10980 [Verrucomicrobiota bacterium]
MNWQRILWALILLTLVWSAILLYDHSPTAVNSLPSTEKVVKSRPENVHVNAPVVGPVLPPRPEKPSTANEWTAFFRSGGLREFSYEEVRLDTETLKEMGVDSKVVDDVTNSLSQITHWLQFSAPKVTQLEEISKLEYEPEIYDPTNLGVPFGEGTFFRDLKHRLGDKYTEVLPMVHGLLDTVKHDPLLRDFGREKLVVTFKDSNDQNGKRGWEVSERVYDVGGQSIFDRNQFTVKIPSPYDLDFKVVEGEQK